MDHLKTVGYLAAMIALVAFCLVLTWVGSGCTTHVWSGAPPPVLKLTDAGKDAGLIIAVCPDWRPGAEAMFVSRFEVDDYTRRHGALVMYWSPACWSYTMPGYDRGGVEVVP